MHRVAVLIVEALRRHNRLVVPLLHAFCTIILQIYGPTQHDLTVATVSWTVICLGTVLRSRLRPIRTAAQRPLCWIAGAFLAWARICERAACDREGISSTKGFVPILVVLVSEYAAMTKCVAPSIPASLLDTFPANNQHNSRGWPYKLLISFVLSASIALSTQWTMASTMVLSISSAIFTAVGLTLLENALMSSSEGPTADGKELGSANSSIRRSFFNEVSQDHQIGVLRDISAVIAMTCGFATFLIEPRYSSSVISWEPVYRDYARDWRTLHFHLQMYQLSWTTCINMIVNLTTFTMLCHHGAVRTSLLSTFAIICAKLQGNFFVWRFPLVIINALSGILLSSHYSPTSSILEIRNAARLGRVLFIVTVLLAGILLFPQLRSTTRRAQKSQGVQDLSSFLPNHDFEPLPMNLDKGHPAAQVIDTAERGFQEMVGRQSSSLEQAVNEYRRRNGIPPPPHFDKWYEFATRHETELIDEFDSIHRSLLPFWALKPAIIRSRMANALGHEDNALIAVAIRNGNVVKVENGEEWVQQAIVGMMKPFVQYLPDMDLGFNIHDEPRVVVPNDHLSAMVAAAQREVLPLVAETKTPRNSFSSRPSDLNDGNRFEEAKVTRFNRFAHQQTWTHSRLSCPTTSQAQRFEDSVPDNQTAYAAGPLGYIYNTTAFSDVCNSPSLSSSFGFFERPNAFNIIHELTPVFSSSKISSYQDILFPSPWYWFGKVGYDENRDLDWDNKNESLYWRGSTTGGFSRNGGWRRQHRQRIVQHLNALDKASILIPWESDSNSDNPPYSVRSVDRRAYESLINVAFSHIGQCDPGDCDAQREFFRVTERAEDQDAWYYKHLLDMDGNAFSGRFYAFLRSKSLTYKMAVFREWHQERLVPWVHFVPLSLRGEEHLDLVHWFAGAGNATDEVGSANEKNTPKKDAKTLGERKAREIAERSREWAGRVLRNVDLEIWFFRLLLEYGRIVDNDREKIGYAGP